jgi:hypothetical protein
MFKVYLVYGSSEEEIGVVRNDEEFFELLSKHMKKQGFKGYFRVIGPTEDYNYIIDYGSHTKFLKVSAKLNLMKGIDKYE